MKKPISFLLAVTLTTSLLLTGCSKGGSKSDSTADATVTGAVTQAADGDTSTSSGDLGTSKFLKIVEITNPTTVDPQSTTEYYGVSMNVFNRLVEVQANGDGTSKIVPSLADSWTISDDGLTYTFKLHEGVKFSNGADLTADDVLYTFTRLLTYSKSQNGSTIDQIKGAAELADGSAKTLEGFKIIDDYNFTITLKAPYAAFLACLSTPAASILDRDTTEAAGDDFGIVPEKTIGSGYFIFKQWDVNSQYVMVANKNCWAGAPKSEGIVVKIVPDADTQRMMFESGEIDILDLDNAQSQTDYFLKNDTYKNQIVSGNRVGIYYIAMNQSYKPLSDVRVRKAIQMVIDRQGLLDALFGGRGTLENGIFPVGLIGHNNNLPALTYDVEGAKKLMAEAGYADGFDLEISQSSEAGNTTVQTNQIIQAMLGEIGIKVKINVLDDATYMDKRAAGEIQMYNTNWSADFNDPDNFIYTFFGTAENTKGRCFCYPDTATIKRVTDARAIVKDDERIAEYQALEKKIVQDDACWVPLYSVKHLFVVNPRVKNFTVSWNGWSNNYYQNVSIED